MPPRLNKRQLRELEELQALEAPETHDEQLESEEEAPLHGVSTGFAALIPAGEEDIASEDDDVPSSAKSKKKKKKKKASGVSIPATSAAPTPTPAKHDAEMISADAGPSNISKKERKALKKQRTRAAKASGDDIDQALAELSMKYPELKRATNVAVSSMSSPAFISLLQVSLSHLDSEAEMRKFFGAKVISASKASSSGATSAAARRLAAATKSNLTRPQPTWWPAAYRHGLSSRVLSAEELKDRQQRHGWNEDVLGEKIWTVEYSRKYRGMTKVFMQMVMSGDPDGLFQLLRSSPYHADTLLQLSEVYFHREEHSTAADLIDRALFTYERAFVGSFNFTSGLNRLDFDRVENRPFFLAVHRQVSDLQRRGCTRTAFEFARLLYGLDPSTDPHGALLHLDYLSIKSGMSDWLLGLWDAQCNLTDEQWEGRMHIRALPGWAYSRALALFVQEESKHDKEHVESSNALLEAVHAFPSVVPVLSDKADISLSANIRSHPAFRIVTDATMMPNDTDAILHLLSHLYAQRSFSLWKVKSRSGWFASVLNEFANNLPVSLEPPTSPKSPSQILLHHLFSAPVLASSVYRHVIVQEAAMRAGRLFGFVPASVTTGRQLACDPLPPPTRVSEYNNEFFQDAEDPTSVQPGGRNAQRLLERLVPDPVFRRQLQDFFEANPHFAQRFPGGIVEFAQIAGQLPEELLEDLMIAEVAAGGGRGMPGQMPGENLFDEDVPEDARAGVPHVDAVQRPGFAGLELDSEDEEEGDRDEDEDEDEEDVAPLPIRILRNVLNRLWGGTANNADESSDEDEVAQLRDDQGVD